MTLQLKKFNMASIPDDSVVVMIGKRNTGKSFLIKDFLYYKQDIPVGTVISGTEDSNGFYSTLVPPLFIHNEYNDAIVERVLLRQQKVISKMKEETANVGYTNIDPRAFIILDDCMYDSSWTKSKSIRYIFTNGRHRKIAGLIAVQDCKFLPPALRGNVDYAFILRDGNIGNRKRIYDSVAGCFPTFDIFCATMDACTEDYGCLVVHNGSRSNKLEEQVYWYRAESHDDFRIGADVFWQFHENNYSNEGNDDDSFNLNSITRKNKVAINIEKIF